MLENVMLSCLKSHVIRLLLHCLLVATSWRLRVAERRRVEPRLDELVGQAPVEEDHDRSQDAAQGGRER